MRGERYVVLGLAHVRSPWFRELARWSTTAAVPVEFVQCVSIEELRTRLTSGRAFSAVIADAGITGFDRDLADLARRSGCAVLVVDDGRVPRDWSSLGASAVLPSDFARADLLEALTTSATVIGRGDLVTLTEPPAGGAGAWRGRLLAVTGSGGTGASVVAMALAQGLGADPRHGGSVLLADLALDADQAMLHDAGDVVPALQELVDAHRSGQPTAQDVRALTFAVPERDYHLLLGLRRHRDWVTVRRRSLEAALDSLRRTYKAVVADVGPDVEGEAECGSIDIEDRNLLARTSIVQADVVVLVGLPGVKGVHRLVRTVHAMVGLGVDPNRILPVINRAPRGPRPRAELTAAVARLATPITGDSTLAPPVFLPERRRFDDLLRDGVRLPAPMTTTLAAAATAVWERTAPATLTSAPQAEREPVPVTPGSLGSWHDDESR